MKRIFTNRVLAAPTALSLLAVMVLAGCSLDSGRDKTRVITFDTGAELTAEATKPTRSMKLEMYPGEILSELPEPSFPGYQFRGWYTEPEEGAPFVTPWEVTKDIQVYAYWGNPADPAKDYHVIFDPSGGTINGSATATVNVKRPPWTIFNLPYPVKGGDAFGGWFTDPPGSTPDYTKELSVVTPIVPLTDANGAGRVYAYWYPGPKTFTVTFNANGGGWGTGVFSRTASVTTPAAKTVNEAGTWPANPSMAGFPLVGWFTGDNVEFTGDTRVTKDISVAAKWIYSAVPEITYGVDAGDNFMGTLGSGETVNVIENTGTTVDTENGYKVLQFPNTAAALDLGQLAGSYFAEDAWTFELYINLGSTTAAGSAKAIRFYTDKGQEADGALWMEGHGLIVVRPNTGERHNFGPDREKWYHLALVRDSSGLTTYINGVFQKTLAAPALANAAFKSVSHCRFMSMNNARLYQVTFTKSAKTTFPGVQAVVDGLSGL